MIMPRKIRQTLLDPGTFGNTKAAHVLAEELSLPIYQKYIPKVQSYLTKQNIIIE